MKIKSYTGAGIMLFRGENGKYEVLLGKRSIDHGYGKWAIPGGKMEKWDNTFYNCAVRELNEETGIDIRTLNNKVVASRKISVPFFHWTTFLVHVSDPLPPLVPREFSELKWIPVEDVGKFDLWINLNKEIRTFRKNVQSTEQG